MANFIDWWSHEVHSRLSAVGIRTILAFSCELTHPDEKFAEDSSHTLKMATLQSGMRLELLNELTEVTVDDVLDFLEFLDVNLVVHGDERRKLIEEIVESCEGNYDCVLAKLPGIVAQAHKIRNKRFR